MSTPASGNSGSANSGPGASGPEPELFQPPQPAQRDPRSTLPWIIAGGVVIVVLSIVIAFGHRAQPANPGGAGLAPPDPYAASLPITHLQMSQANSMVGNNTYIDGQITNTGDKVVTGVTVQVAFRDVTNQIVQKNTMAMNLIRTRQPYVDTEPVSAAPLGPAQTAEFRLIFDHVADAWNQNYPDIRIIQVAGK